MWCSSHLCAVLFVIQAHTQHQKTAVCVEVVPSPSLSLAMSILPLFICRVACSAGRSWWRRAGSCNRAGDGDWTDWGTCPEEEEEEEDDDDMVEGVEPKAPGAVFRLWEEEEEEEWPELDAVDWSPDMVSVETSRPDKLSTTERNIWGNWRMYKKQI